MPVIRSFTEHRPCQMASRALQQAVKAFGEGNMEKRLGLEKVVLMVRKKVRDDLHEMA